MSNHTPTQHKLLAWIVILAQILAMTSTGVATVVQPTPDMAHSASRILRLPPWLAERAANLASLTQPLFGIPQTIRAH